MRVPARFALLVLLAAVPLSALGAQVLTERVAALHPGTAWQRRAPAMVTLALVALFLVELGAKTPPLQTVPTGVGVPAVYRWLARERPGPVVEIPLDPLGGDQEYVYLSTVHWLPLVNGRSGFAPGSHDEVKTFLAELPGPRGREYAATLGLRALVVHGERLSREERVRWAAAEGAGHVRRLATFGPDAVYAVAPVALAPTLVARLEVPAFLARETDARLGLRLASVDGRPWAHGRPHGLAPADVRWTDLAAGAGVVSSVPVALPLVVGGAERAPALLRVVAPSRHGRYALDVTLPSLGIATERRIVEVRDSPPATAGRETGDRLAARYLVEDGADARRLGPGEFLRVRLAAFNTGEGVWPSKPRGKKGDVALRWRWLDAQGREVAGTLGQRRIRYDVHPGQRYEFDEWPAAPIDAGRYVLEVALVAAGVGAFTADAPVRIALDVGGAATGAARP